MKKELVAYHKNGSALYSLKFVSGGELPERLRGEFTSTMEAYRLRDLYYAGKLPKRIQPVQCSVVRPAKQLTPAKPNEVQEAV